MWIQNVSMTSLINGLHYFAEHKTVLIQIQDVGTTFATPLYDDKFVEKYQFQFMDNDVKTDPDNITDDQAKQIAEILVNAKERNLNIVVSCHAGLCRSGAVADVGIQFGFDDTETQRMPNILVKNRIKEHLGMTVDYNEIFKFTLSDWE